MVLESGQKARDPLDQSIIDLALVFQCLDMELALLALRVDLVLLGTNKRSLVDIWMDLDVGIIAELESILHGTSGLVVVSSKGHHVDSLPICCNRQAS